MLVAFNHDFLLFFTNSGRVYQIRTHEVPDASRQSKGIPLVNVMSLTPDERVTAVIDVPDFSLGDYLLMCTANGEIKKTKLSEFEVVRSSGLIAMDLEQGDELSHVAYCQRGSDVMMFSSTGQSIRFSEGRCAPPRVPWRGAGMRWRATRRSRLGVVVAAKRSSW